MSNTAFIWNSAVSGISTAGLLAMRDRATVKALRMAIDRALALRGVPVKAE